MVSDYVFRILVRGMDSAVFGAVLDDVVRQAIVDRLLTHADADAFKHDVEASRGAAAASFAERYLVATGRPDRELADLWLYVAAMAGNRASAAKVAQRISSMAADGGTDVPDTEVSAAIQWWRGVAAEAAPPPDCAPMTHRDVLQTIRAVNSAQDDEDDPWGAQSAPRRPGPSRAISVDAWRTMTQFEIRQRLRAYRSLLAGVTAFPAERDRAILTKALSGSPRHALAVSDLLRDQAEADDEADGDIRWAWVCIAALSNLAAEIQDRQVAVQMMVTKLAGMAHDAASGRDWREAVALKRLTFSWVPSLTTVHDADSEVRAGFFRKWSATGLSAVGAPEAPSAVPPGGKDSSAGLIVVKGIDPGRGSADDRNLIKAWECLTRPVPLTDGPDPDVLEAVLAGEFPWLGEAISAICGDLRLRRGAGQNWAHFRPVLLVGPPGSGKIRFARRVAEIIRSGYGELSVGGSSDNRLLQGTARGWSTASPSFVLQVVRRSMTANPIMFVDEIDKAVGSHNGDVRNTLLSMLEPLSAKRWTDECLVGECDLSAVNWILAANDVDKLRGPLLTRLRVLKAPAPGAEHFQTVLASIRRDLAAELGIGADDLPPLLPEAEATLAAGIRRGISLRRLRAAVEGAVKTSGGLSTVMRH